MEKLDFAVPMKQALAAWRFELEESGAQYLTGAGTFGMVTWYAANSDMSKQCACLHTPGESNCFELNVHNRG